MSTAQVFFALDRKAAEEFLAMAVKDMDDLTLKNAVYSLITAYKPALLKDLEKDVVPALHAAVATHAPAETVILEEMRTATDENVARLARQKRIDWVDAWTELRCKELEDGESICCSEECEGNDSAIDELVWAAEAGKKKRNERRIAEGRPVSPDQSEDENSSKPYIAPPKVRDAEEFWPFMRCKNVVKALLRSQPSRAYYEPPPKNHHGLLEYIAKVAKLDMETLKKSSPRDVFKGNYYVLQALGNSSRW